MMRAWRPAVPNTMTLCVERLLQEVVDDLRVGLAAGRLHDLADEPADQGGLGLVGLDLLGVGGDDLLDRRLDRAGVGDLLQPALLDPHGGILPGLLPGYVQVLCDSSRLPSSLLTVQTRA